MTSTIIQNHYRLRYTNFAMTIEATRKSPRLPEELVDSTSFLLKRLGFSAKGRSIAAFEQAGHSPYAYAVLATLDEGQRETQAAIADALGYDRSQLVGILDELEEQNLIERQRDKADRRRHLVLLTPDGRKALAKLRALTSRLDNEFLAPLSDEEREDLHRLLLKLAEVHEPRCAPMGLPGAASK
jgi:MarR family transcriptional regulator, lower aerobic nicotinate degradation pathway regulator